MFQPRRGMPFLFLSLVLLLAGCGAANQAGAPPVTATATPQPTATPRPLAVQVHRVSLPGYTVRSDTIAAGGGFVFADMKQDAQGQPLSELRYYDLATGKTALADSAPWDPNRPTVPSSGTTDTIWFQAASGDLVVYMHIGVSGAPSKLLALDVARWRQFTLSTTTSPLAGGESNHATVATDGQRVVWMVPTYANGGPGASTIHVLDTSTGATQAFPTEAGSYYSLALASGSLFYARSPSGATRGAQIPIFRQPLTGGAPEQLLTTTVGFGLVGGDRYLAVDQSDGNGGGTTNVLDLQAPSGQPKVFSCTRPQLSGRYLACVAWNQNVQLYDLSTGASAVLAAGERPLSVSISSARAVWWNGQDKVAEYVTLP